MLTKVSSKGQMVLPAAIREMARIRPGDELDVGLSGGMIVLRKRRPLSSTDVKRLLRQGRELPVQSEAETAEVAAALDRVRERARRG